MEKISIDGFHNVKTQPEWDKKAGVIWYTQGLGKSLLMVFYAGNK